MDIKFSLEAFRQAAYDCEKAEYEYLQAETDADLIKKQGENYLAVLKQTILAGLEQKVSESRLEREARCTESWKVYFKGYEEACRKAATLKAQYKAAERRWETLRSGLSFRREELKRIGD